MTPRPHVPAARESTPLHAAAVPGDAAISPDVARPGGHPAGGAATPPAVLPAGPRTWTVTLPAGLQLLSLNQRIHWAERHRRNAAVKKAAWAMALQARIPHLERACITVEYQPPDLRPRDADNIAITAKAAIDGLVSARIFESDSSDHVTAVTCRIGGLYPKGRIVIHITEVTS